MPVSASLVGLESKPYVAELEDRWAMNYAASIGEVDPLLYDTRRATLPVHPMYLAHPEWEATKLLVPNLGLTPEESSSSIEMSHDTLLRRPLTSRVTLSTTARVTGVERHRTGAVITFDYATSINAGDEIGVTRMRALYRGVEVEGDERPAHALPEADVFERPEQMFATEVPISPEACHTYSECARIWNPFHTDIKVAEVAGIAGLILHGTATLAKAASVACQQTTDMCIERVTRIRADLRAMVFAPSTTHLHLSEPHPNGRGSSTVVFDLLTDDGGKALTRGAISYHPVG